MFIFVFFVSSIVIFVKGERLWHTSQISLTELYDLQNEHFDVINSHLELETKRLDELKNYLGEWNVNIILLSIKEMDSKNQFNVINVMTQIYIRFRKLNHLMNNEMSVKVLKVIDENKDLSGNHITRVSQSLRRLQLFYAISTSDMAAGRHMNKTIGDPMNSCECYVLLEICFEEHDMICVMDWAIEVCSKWKREGQPKCVNMEKLNLYTNTSSEFIGSYFTHLIESNGLRHPKGIDDLINYYSLLRNNIPNTDENRILKALEMYDYSIDYGWLHIQFAELCKRGESKITLTKYSKCRYQSKNSHYRRLMPFKEEDINSEPQIKIYHDVIYDSEIRKLKRVAFKARFDARVGDKDFPDGRVDERIRSCQSVYISEKKAKKQLASLDARIRSFTGLSTSSAEPYVINNYGLGGHYNLHYDEVSSRDNRLPMFEQLGCRLATVLFYLTDVEYGGYTVFPLLNIVSPAEKGAALVFYNLNSSNGDFDEHILHGACPVLKGNKWITTRWLHESDQNLPYYWKNHLPKMYQRIFNID